MPLRPVEQELRSRLRAAPAVSATPPVYGRLMAGALACGALSLGFGFVLPTMVGAGELAPAATPAPALVAPPVASAPVHAPPANATAGTQACPISLPPAAGKGFGKALGPVPAEIAEPSVARAEAFVHGKVSPEYQGKPREFVSILTPRGQIFLYAVIPDGMVVKPGEIVQVEGRHRDMTKPCSYVPFVLTGLVAGKG
jgi:hypothetical protein